MQSASAHIACAMIACTEGLDVYDEVNSRAGECCEPYCKVRPYDYLNSRKGSDGKLLSYSPAHSVFNRSMAESSCFVGTPQLLKSHSQRLLFHSETHAV